jgi:hypothetical protein
MFFVFRKRSSLCLGLLERLHLAGSLRCLWGAGHLKMAQKARDAVAILSKKNVRVSDPPSLRIGDYVPPWVPLAMLQSDEA